MCSSRKTCQSAGQCTNLNNCKETTHEHSHVSWIVQSPLALQEARLRLQAASHASSHMFPSIRPCASNMAASLQARGWGEVGCAGWEC